MEGSQCKAPAMEQEFNISEWQLRAGISRNITLSRRHSASHIRGFREEDHSLRSNFTISSTTSSPGYLLKDEIDPSTYSFTTALKALQARSGYVWEWLSADQGLALNSKWYEAEKYICNPLSGEFPMECLSTKTLTGKSFRNNMAGRVTMSGPLVFSAKNYPKTTPHPPPPPRHNNNNSNNKHAVSTSSLSVVKQQLLNTQFLPQEKEEYLEEEKQMESRTRDVGTQRTPGPGEESSSSLSPASTPSIQERSIQRSEETEDASITLKPVDECKMQVQVKITREGEETKRRTKGAKKMTMKKKKTGKLCNWFKTSGYLLLSTWRCLWIKNRQRDKLKSTFSPTPK